MNRWRVVTFLILWGTVAVLLLTADAQPSVFVIGGTIAIALASVFIVADSAWLTEHRVWATPRRPPGSAATIDQRAATLERQARAAIKTDSATLHATLLDLLDDALLDRHGIERSSAPADADAILTPRLRRLTAGPDRRTGSINGLRHIIDDIEAI